MKAFEEYALNGRKKPTNPQTAILHSWHDQELAAKYWRAALELVYSKLDHSAEHEELKDFIEKELEN